MTFLDKGEKTIKLFYNLTKAQRQNDRHVRATPPPIVGVWECCVKKRVFILTFNCFKLKRLILKYQLENLFFLKKFSNLIFNFILDLFEFFFRKK
jgi:hypothetical protein